jgi:hypothetical protein
VLKTVVLGKSGIASFTQSRLVREDRMLAVFNPAWTMRSVWWAVPLFLVFKRKARRPKGNARAYRRLKMSNERSFDHDALWRYDRAEK